MSEIAEIASIAGFIVAVITLIIAARVQSRVLKHGDIIEFNHIRLDRKAELEKLIFLSSKSNVLDQRTIGSIQESAYLLERYTRLFPRADRRKLTKCIKALEIADKSSRNFHTLDPLERKRNESILNHRAFLSSMFDKKIGEIV